MPPTPSARTAPLLPFGVTKYQNASGTESFRVSGTWNGERMRKNFADRATAEAVCNAKNAEALAPSARKQRLVPTTLSDEELAAAEAVVARAQGRWPIGRIGEAGLAALESVPVSEPVAALAQEWFKLIEGEVNERWRHDLASRVGRFVRDNPKLMTEGFTRPMVRKWLDGLKVGTQTRANTRNCLHRFAAWLVERGKLRENPAGGIRIKRREADAEENGTPPTVLTPAQAKAFLAACEGAECKRLKGWVALCLFCGLRPESEAPRLTWAEVNFQSGECSVMSRKRGAKPRVFKMTPQALAWMLAVMEDGAAQPGRYWRHLRTRAVELANERLAECGEPLVVWDEDILRHSCASYRASGGMALHLLAADLGTSTKAIYRYYRHPRPAAEVAAFSKIMPKSSRSDE